MADFKQAIPIILAHEGGAKYSNIPGDKGGPTKWGITQETLSRWRCRNVFPKDVRTLTEKEARAIYRAYYWTLCRCEDIRDQTVATKVFDIAVNLGVHRRGIDAAELLQRAVNYCAPSNKISVDGVIGSRTIQLVNLCRPDCLLDALCMEQRNYYLELIAANPSQEKFRKGWLRRAEWKGDTK
jgi:lysozyme family protein